MIAVTVFCSLLFGTNTSNADERPIIPGFERFHESANAVEMGNLLLSELRCAACHEGLPTAAHPRKAPNLQDVGSRLRPKSIQAIAAAPHTVKPGTLMPSMLPDAERDKAAEAITHFLVGNNQLVDTPPTGFVRGEKLFHEVGCMACHTPMREGADPIAGSVPLGFVDKKYTVPSLTAFLKNPHAVRPSGRMPNLNLSDEEAQNIAGYLLKDLKVAANLTYKYYEGNWSTLPKFDSLKPKSSGIATGFDLGVSARKDRFGIVFEGYLLAGASGEYEFEIGSDDGSRLIVDGETLITVDGIHPMTRRKKKKTLEAGFHKVRVEYFEGSGGEELEVKVSGPGISKQDLAGLVTSTAERQKKDQFVVQPALAKQGMVLFSEHGCASCHDVKRNDQLVGSPIKGGRITHLTGGCLDASPPSGVPNYHLSDKQRTSIQAALKATSRSTGPTIASTMQTFNCYACHQRDKIGGVERARDAYFVTKIPEMGDEGRIPPSLDGVGDKLNDAWLKHVMNNGANDRPYMLTRMPKFGTEHVGSITTAFAKTDRREEVGAIKIDAPPHRVKGGGRLLVGGDGLSCIKCHYFGKYKSTGIQALDLQTMTRRLRRDWFHRYVLDPQKYRPGTRMPQAWPFGKVIMKKVLDGTAPTQIEAVWQYLADGTEAAIPRGLVAGKMELKPLREAIIYRNFITGLSPRGIAVGTPANAHYAWDATDMSLALIWQDAFIDAAKHWTGRGQGRQDPLGGNQFSLVRGIPFAMLENQEQPWPNQNQAAQFQGYRLMEQGTPAFRWTLKGLAVEDKPVGVKGEQLPELHRELQVSMEPGQTWYFRAAAGESVKPMGDGVYLVNGAVEMSFEGDVAEPIIRKIGGSEELLVKLKASTPGKAKFTQVIRW